MQVGVPRETAPGETGVLVITKPWPGMPRTVWRDHARLIIAIDERPAIDGADDTQATVMRRDVVEALADFLADARQRLTIDADALLSRHIDHLLDHLVVSTGGSTH